MRREGKGSLRQVWGKSLQVKSKISLELSATCSDLFETCPRLSPDFLRGMLQRQELTL
jgi:hypothetical protein